MRTEAFGEAGDHAVETGLPGKRQAVDGFVLFKIPVVGALENHRIFLPGQLDDRFETQLFTASKPMHAGDMGGAIFF
jgi:hypothetical protein